MHYKPPVADDFRVLAFFLTVALISSIRKPPSQVLCGSSAVLFFPADGHADVAAKSPKRDGCLYQEATVGPSCG